MLPFESSFSYQSVANMPANLAKIPALPRDEAFAVTADFIADHDPKKVSLGAGVYRDENSKPWVLPSVQAVCS